MPSSSLLSASPNEPNVAQVTDMLCHDKAPHHFAILSQIGEDESSDEGRVPTICDCIRWLKKQTPQPICDTIIIYPSGRNVNREHTNPLMT